MKRQNKHLMTSQFLENLFEKLSVLTNISFTQNGVRHRRMNRGSYYRHFLRWNFDIGGSSRPVVNRDMLNSSGLSQASLLSLAALSCNQFNSQYINLASNVLRRELPILSMQGISPQNQSSSADTQSVLSSIARSLGLTTNSTAHPLITAFVVQILREMVRRGPPEGVTFSDFTESEFRDSINTILQSVFTGHHEDPSSPQSVFTGPHTDSSSPQSTGPHTDSSYPQSTGPHEDPSVGAPESSFQSQVPEITTLNQSAPDPQSSSDSPTSTSSSFHSVSSGEISVVRELLSSPEFISLCIMVIFTIINIYALPDPLPEPADALPPALSNSIVTGPSEVAGSQADDHIVNETSVGYSTKSIILSGIVILTIIWLGFPADGLSPIDVDPQLAFPT
jgi:hypothetical protein